MNEIIARPAMDVQTAVDQYNLYTQFVNSVMKKDLDYGIVPGTGQKPSLFKPGAEKLINFFGLSQEMKLIDKVEDWTGASHNGEPFFYYHYQARLVRGGILVAEEEGSCNSWEKKYRYRKAERVCPECNQPTIKVSKQPGSEGSYYCYAKIGGCGAKYKKGDPAIEGQDNGYVPNPEIFDQVNTIKKMAQKRALVAAALVACRASDYFTQDVEDLVYDAAFTVSEGATYQHQPEQQQQTSRVQPPTPPSGVAYKHVTDGKGMDTHTPIPLASSFATSEIESMTYKLKIYEVLIPLNKLNQNEAKDIIKFLRSQAASQGQDVPEHLDGLLALKKQSANEVVRSDLSARMDVLFSRIQNTEADLSEHVAYNKCVKLDRDNAPIDHLQKAVDVLSTLLSSLEQQAAGTAVDTSTEPDFIRWAKHVREAYIDFQPFKPQMVLALLKAAAVAAKDHSSLSAYINFSDQAPGMEPAEIYERIGDDSKCDYIVKEAKRLGIHTHAPKQPVVRKGR